ncbi:MAG: LamG-like jellyroll fold domain-containing protein [Candidatus Nanohaloarchaea archaeon]
MNQIIALIMGAAVMVFAAGSIMYIGFSGSSNVSDAASNFIDYSKNVDSSSDSEEDSNTETEEQNVDDSDLDDNENNEGENIEDSSGEETDSVSDNDGASADDAPEPRYEVSSTEIDGVYEIQDTDYTEEFTISTWIKPDYSTNWEAISGRGDCSYQIRRLDGTQLITAEFRGGLNDCNSHTTVSSTVPENEWSHVAVTFSREEETAEMYVNSVKTDSSSVSQSVGSVDTPLQIGANYDDAEDGSESFRRHWNGEIDEFKIFDRAISQGDITSIYQSSNYHEKASENSNNIFLHELFESGESTYVNTDRSVPSQHALEATVITDEVSRKGDYSLKTSMDYDWDYSGVNSVRVNPSLNDRGDRIYDNVARRWNSGFWHTFSFYVPEDFEEDENREQIYEFHRSVADLPVIDYDNFEGWTEENQQQVCDYTSYCLGNGKPLSVNVQNDKLIFINSYVDEYPSPDSTGPSGDLMDIQGGLDRNNILSDGSLETDEQGEYIRRTDWAEYSEDLEPGTWYDITMQIKWSHHGEEHEGEEGLMKIWVNDSLVYDHEGPTTAREVNPPRSGKFGIYKWVWEGMNERPRVTERKYYFDNFKYGGSSATFEEMNN